MRLDQLNSMSLEIIQSVYVCSRTEQSNPDKIKLVSPACVEVKSLSLCPVVQLTAESDRTKTDDRLLASFDISLRLGPWYAITSTSVSIRRLGRYP